MSIAKFAFELLLVTVSSIAIMARWPPSPVAGFLLGAIWGVWVTSIFWRVRR